MLGAKFDFTTLLGPVRFCIELFPTRLTEVSAPEFNILAMHTGSSADLLWCHRKPDDPSLHFGAHGVAAKDHPWINNSY